MSDSIESCMEKASATPKGVFFIVIGDMTTALNIVDTIEETLGYRVIEKVELLDVKNMYRVTLRNESLIYVVTEKMHKRLVGRKSNGNYRVKTNSTRNAIPNSG